MIETFIKAFKANRSGFRGECNCGREFYNPADCWDFEDSEIKWLEQDTNSTEIMHDVRYVELNHREYVIDCDCWHDKAKRFMSVIDEHDEQIASYLNKERERKIFEAERVQIVEILSKTDIKDEDPYDDDIPF